MNRASQIALYIVVGLATLVFFILYFFPLDAVISDSLANMEKLTQGEYRITISQMEPSLIFDSEFKDFRVWQKSKTGSEEIFFAPRIKARVALLALLSGSLNASLTAYYKNGSISGDIDLSDDQSVADVEFDSISLADLPFLKKYLEFSGVQLGLSGQLEGSIYAAFEKDMKDSVAEVKINIYGAQLDEFEIVAFGMKVPALQMTANKTYIAFEASLDKGEIKLSRFNIPGPDLEMQLSGTARLGRGYSVVQSSFDGKFAFSADYVEKVPFIHALDAQKTAEGFYPLTISGNLSKPRLKIGDMDVTQGLKITP